jgi:predicted dehydrogenase
MEVGSLVSGTHPVAEAEDVYAQLRDGTLHGVGHLFEYDECRMPLSSPGADQSFPSGSSSSVPVSVAPASPAAPASGTTLTPPQRNGHGGPKAALPSIAPPSRATVRLGFIGAGNYATSMLLPHLAADPMATLATVATTRSLSAVNAQRKFGFDEATTDVRAVLDDPGIDAVFIVTRHHSHADFVCRALEAGKAVFVEKPLALTRSDVDRVLAVVERTGNDRLMVGFNRRFAPLFTMLRQRFGPVAGPMSVRYLVNAGRLDPSSWYLDEVLEGSRFLGEGGHFIDTVSAWIGHAPVEVTAQQTSNLDLHVVLRHADGSLATITYATGGDSRFPKETLDASGNGRNARLDNFARATVWGRSGKNVKRSLGQDKGQRQMLRSFLQAVREGAPMPIDVESIVATTRATIAVAESAALGTRVAP